VGTQRIELPAPGSSVTAPNECSVTFDGGTTDSCNYYVACPSTTFTSRVQTTGAEWSTCFTNSEHSYRFSGIEGTDACAFATNFCVNFPENLTSPPVCEVDIDSTPDGTCQYLNQCTQAVDLGFGVTAEVASSYAILSCYPGAASGYDCECRGDTIDARAWHMESLDDIDPCNDLQALCFGSNTFSIGRAAGTQGECDADPVFATDNQCQITERCTHTQPYGTNTTLSVTETETSQCVNAGDGWNCTCNASGVRSARFSPIGEPAPETLCNDALDVCRQPTIEGSGALTCSEAVLEDAADGCEIDFECEQPIAAGTQEVIRKSSGSVVCDVTLDGWQCGCRYGAEQEWWLLDAQLTSMDACSQAVAACSPNLAL